MKKLLNKWRNIPAGVKSSVAYFLSRLVTAGIAYLIMPIYTRLLSPEEYGQVSIFLTWTEIIGIVAMFCLSYGVYNNGMMDYKDDRDGFAFSMLILSNIITIGCAAVVFIIYFLTDNLISVKWPLMILMFVIFLFQPAYSFWTARQRFEYKYKAVSIVTVLSAIFSPLVAIVLILVFPDNKLYARLFGAEAVFILIYCFFYINLIRKNKFKVKVKYWKYAILFNLPLILHYLSTYLLGGMDKLMISFMIGDSAAAFYSVAYSVASVVTIVWSAANASLVPYTYEKCEKKDYKSISKVALPILAVFAVICLILILLAPEVVAIMSPSAYREAIYAIPPIVGGVFFQVQYFLYANILYYFKKSKFVMIGSVTATILNGVLNYFCIKKFGYIAAGYTTLICYFVQAAIDYIAMRKIIGHSVYNMKIIGLLSLMLILISVFSNLTYDYYIVRYCALALIVVLAIIFRKHIMGALKIKSSEPKPEQEEKLLPCGQTGEDDLKQEAAEQENIDHTEEGNQKKEDGNNADTDIERKDSSLK